MCKYNAYATFYASFSGVRNYNETSPDFNFKTHVKLSKSTFSFQEVSTDMIVNIVQSLQNKTSSGTDGISNVMF